MTRIGNNNAGNIGVYTPTLDIPVEPDRTQENQEANKTDKSALKADGLDPAKAQLLQELFGGGVSETAALSQRALQDNQLDAQNASLLQSEQVFAGMVTQLAEPKPGQQLGKAFAHEAAHESIKQFAEMSEQAIATGALLLSAGTTVAGKPTPKVLEQYTRFFDKLISKAPGKSGPAVVSSGQEATELHQKLAATGIFGLYRSAMSGKKDASSIVPTTGDVVSAIDGEPDGSAPDDGDPLHLSSSRDANGQLTNAMAEFGAGQTATPTNNIVSVTSGPAAQTIAATAKVIQQQPGPTMDIDQMVEQVMFECGQDTENEVRDFLKVMQTNINKKAALNKLAAQYKDGQNKLNDKMQTEFNTLQNMTPPMIGQGWTLDDYKTYRQVSWSDPTTDAQGNMSITSPGTCQPFPPDIPAYMRKDKNPTPVSGTDGKTTGPNSSDPAVMYGIPTALKTQLQQIYGKLPADVRSAGSFTEWLSDVVGLTPASSIDDVRANAQTISDYMSKTLPKAITDQQSLDDKSSNQAENKANQLYTQLTAMITGVSGDTPDANLVASIISKMGDLESLVGSAYLNAGDRDKLRGLEFALKVKIGGCSDPTTRDTLGGCLTNVDSAIGFALPPKDVDQTGKTLYPGTTPWIAPIAQSQIDTWTSGINTQLAQLPNNGIGPTEMATQAKANLQNILTSGTPPLTAAQKTTFQALLDTYKDPTQDDPQAFLDALKDVLVTANFRPGGQDFAVAQAIVGDPDYTPPPPPPSSTTTGAGQTTESGGGLTSGALLANTKFTTFNPGATFVSTKFVGILLNIPTGPPGPYSPPPADPKEVGHRLDAFLLGDDSHVELSDWEKQLVKDGIMEDPKSEAADRQKEFTEQAGKEKEATEGTGQQVANPGDTHVGSPDDFAAQGDAIKTQIDSLGDLSQLDSMKLQILMDRRSKFYETLSNIMKKISDARDGIISNIKN